MKKNIITGSIILVSAGTISAQGLYDIAPDYTAKVSSPIKWSAGASVGIDDNLGSRSFNEDEVSYLSAFVGASLVNITPQTTWDAFATVGGRIYFEEPEGSGDDFVPQVKFSFNVTHELSERLRLVSNNYIAYESAPDYENGFGGNGSDYLHYNTTNSIGYRWTERLGTYTGFSVRGLMYNDSEFDANDRQSYSVFNNFRYNLSEQSILTFGYRYSWTDASGSASNSNSHIITAGLERRLNENSLFTLRGGVQIRSVDDGGNRTGPYLEAAIRTQINEQFSLRGFAKYSYEDYGTSFQGFTYDTNSTFRLGLTADYRVSPVLTLLGGVNYINTMFEDGRNTTATGDRPDIDQELINLFAGFSYELNDGVFFNGTYNFTTSMSDEDSREFDRNRASLGVRVQF